MQQFGRSKVGNSQLPSQNRQLDIWWQTHLKNKHKDKLSAAKSTIDNTWGGKNKSGSGKFAAWGVHENKQPEYSHLRSNLKRAQKTDERLSEIDNENRILLQKMTNIIENKPNPLDTTVEYVPGYRLNCNHYPVMDHYVSDKTIMSGNAREPKSLNAPYKQREAKRIMKENEGIVNRIQAGRATYHREQWADHTRRSESFSRLASKKHVHGRMPYQTNGMLFSQSDIRPLQKRPSTAPSDQRRGSRGVQMVFEARNQERPPSRMEPREPRGAWGEEEAWGEDELPERPFTAMGGSEKEEAEAALVMQNHARGMKARKRALQRKAELKAEMRELELLALRQQEEEEQKEKAEAALKIQSKARGRKANAEVERRRQQLHKELADLEEEEMATEHAVVVLQSGYRSHAARRNTAERRAAQAQHLAATQAKMDLMDEQAKAATALQKRQRGNAARKNKKKKPDDAQAMVQQEPQSQPAVVAQPAAKEEEKGPVVQFRMPSGSLRFSAGTGAGSSVRFSAGSYRVYPNK